MVKISDGSKLFFLHLTKLNVSSLNRRKFCIILLTNSAKFPKVSCVSFGFGESHSSRQFVCGPNKGALRLPPCTKNAFVVITFELKPIG